MIGQSFAPLMNPNQPKPSDKGPAGSISPGAQQAIKVLNLRIPRVAGVGAPAPQALLEGKGSAGLPQPSPTNPIIDAVLKAVLGHFTPQQQAAPSAMGGNVASGMFGGPLPTPNVVYGADGGPLPTPEIGPEPPPSVPQYPVYEDATREDRMNRRGKMGQDTFVPNLDR